MFPLAFSRVPGQAAVLGRRGLIGGGAVDHVMPAISGKESDNDGDVWH